MAPKGSSKHRPVFHLAVLSVGFVTGGLLTSVARHWLPSGAVREFLTTGVTGSLGPITLDLVILKFGLGPIALDVSLLSLVGVYYTMWLRLEKPNWLWPHVLLTAVILSGAIFGAYGFWQKGFILYLLLLLNVQYSFLKHICPATGVRYALVSVSSKRLPPRRTVYHLDREG